MEKEKGIIPRFVIGRRFVFPFGGEEGFSSLLFIVAAKKLLLLVEPWSDDMIHCSANRGDRFDGAIDSENRQNNDFIILVCLTG